MASTNGPISITTISGDASDLDVREYEITLKIKGTFYRGESPPKNLGLMLNNFLRAWRDGRRPLSVEVMQDAFERILRDAAGECVAEEMRKKYGNEMVASEDGRSHTAKWHLEACKVNTLELIPHLHDDWEAKIERQLTDEEQQAFRDAINMSNKDLAS
ncbi:MAG: hypothetical protein ACYTFQ_21270 [Planctomycetota bacterium]|jgi:hypothetical protein